MEIVILLLLRWFHVIPAIAMVGGLIYMRFVLPPALAQGTDEQFALLRGRWAKVVMISTLLLLLTGIANMGIAGARFDYGDQLPGKLYNMLAGIKFLLALPVFFLAARLSGKSEAAAQMRLRSNYWLNITLAVALVVVMLGGFLRTLHRTPKAKANAIPPAVSAASEKLPLC